MTEPIKSLPLNQRIYLSYELHRFSILPSCLNCEFNSLAQQRLNVPGTAGAPETWCFKHNTSPPLRVLVNACEDWNEAVPF